MGAGVGAAGAEVIWKLGLYSSSAQMSDIVRSSFGIELLYAGCSHECKYSFTHISTLEIFSPFFCLSSLSYDGGVEGESWLATEGAGINSASPICFCKPSWLMLKGM